MSVPRGCMARASPAEARPPARQLLVPSATNISAVRNPMPLVEPVMTATLPLSRPMSFSCLAITCLDYPPACRRYASGLAAFEREFPFGAALIGYADRLMVCHG